MLMNGEFSITALERNYSYAEKVMAPSQWEGAIICLLFTVSTDPDR